MNKCCVCGEINIYYTNEAEKTISETKDNDHIQILADRLLKFEGYERTVNKNYPVWTCEDCRESLACFAKLLKVIKKKRERRQDGEQKCQEQINVEENDLGEHNNLEKNSDITSNILSITPTNEDVFDDTTEPAKESPRKRIKRPPKRFLDNNVYIPLKPIRILKNKTNNYLTSSSALLPIIALIRLSTGHLIGQLMKADNCETSSRFRIKCTICPLVFCSEREFRKHLKNHKEEMANNLDYPKKSSFQNFLYYCEKCQKTFQEHFAVRRHYKHAHSLERPFECAHCTAKFKYKFNFDYHMAKHLDKRNFQCTLCTKKFILQYELLIHQRTHTKEKPFKCQFCSISFAHRSNLVTHRRLHTQQKSLKCAQCQATFRSLVYLKRHERNHGKSKGNLLQRKYCKKYITLPNFNILQSTLKSATLSNNDINNSKTSLHTINEEDIEVSNIQDKETTNNGFHFENSISSPKENILPNTFQILKITKTNDHYKDITISNEKVLKTQTENGSFQIGNTTIKRCIPMSQNKQNKMTKLISSSTNNKYVSFSSHSPKSPVAKIHNESINFKNSTNYSKESLVLKSHPNQSKLVFTNISNVNLNYNQLSFTNSTDSESSTKSPNFQYFENLQNSTKIDSSYNLNSFSEYRKSPLLKTELNQEKLDIAFRNSSYGSISNVNMINFKNTENFMFTDDNNLNDACSTQTLVNVENSPIRTSLLKSNKKNISINSNDKNYDNMIIKHSVTPLAPSICVSKSNMKSFRIVKLSGDFMTNKLKTFSNNNLFNTNLNISPQKIENSPLTKITKVTCENLSSSLSQRSKLKYFTNNDKILKKTAITSNKLNWDDSSNNLVRKNLYANGFFEAKSCLQSPTMQVPNEEISNENSTTQSGEFSEIMSELHPPLSLNDTTNLKEIKLQNTRTEDVSKIKICKNSEPIITTSKDIEKKPTKNSATRHSLAINTSTTAISTNAVQLTTTPKLYLQKSVSNESVTSLLKPKPLSITNIEILAHLKPLNIVNTSTPPTPPSTQQNLLKQLDAYKFQCQYCWKYFKQKSALQKHLRTHTGEKPYKCNLCPKSYADASNYKKHTILHKNAAEALNITRPPQVSPHLLPGHIKQHSPTHSTASDPDPDGIEIMRTLKIFDSSSSLTDDDDDVESLSSSSLESYMWQDALDHAIKNDLIREYIVRNLLNINNSIMPPDMETVKNKRS